MEAATVEAWASAKPAVRARARWELLTGGRPAQRTPPGDWNVWLFMAGRGAGKTRAAAEDMAYYGLTHPRSRLAIVAPTYADARDTCVEGDSGLLACFPREDVLIWNRSLGELVLRNGTRYKLFSSDEPDRLRGPQHHRAWCDELAAFRDPETWDMLLMGLRLGANPQAVVTTTPRPIKLVRDLVGRPDVVVTRASTWENAANLAPSALESLRRKYAGTRKGRQELEGELLEDVVGALWKREWIKVADVPPLDGLRSAKVGLDPSDGTEDGAEWGLCVAGHGLDRLLYVAKSEGLRGSRLDACKRGIALAQAYRGQIACERNHGSGFLEDMMELAMREMGVSVPIRWVTAHRGKLLRAEPVAALYEQGRVRHLGAFPELEDQMCEFTGDPGQPSDRLDACVYALSELMYGGPPTGADGPVAEWGGEPVGAGDAVAAWS